MPSTFPITFPFTFGGIPAIREPAWPPITYAPSTTICSDDQAFTLRTYDGIQLYQFPPTEQLDWNWSRESREVSVCELSVPSVGEHHLLPNITPWLHWIDCWDNTGEVLYWSGPILRASLNSRRLAISARDIGSLMSRTRCLVEKRWESADPAEIAGEMWEAMIEHHNLKVKPIIRNDPRGDRFDFTAKAETGDMDVQMGNLTDLGLRWCVVAGRPIFGPVNLKASVALSEEHFIDDAFEVTRDGTNFCNDVTLRVAGSKSNASIYAGGLQFQKTVTVDSIRGVSNADRAAYQYVQYAGTMRDQVTMPNGAVLHPEAPITLDQLIPSARINIEAFGLLTTMEVSQVSVSRDEEGAQVSVKLESVNDDLPELLTLDAGSRE